MSKFTPPIDDFDLLSKYLSGNASDEEVRQLETWVLADPANQAQFKAFKEAWMLSGMEKNSQNIDVEKEWAATSAQLFPEAKRIDLATRKQSRSSFILKIAAAIALLTVASIWVFRSSGGTGPIEILAKNKVIEQELPDGSTVSLNQFASLSYDAQMDGPVRNVTLKGDAFFDVARDTEHPFIIRTQNSEIEVLGTSFYIDSRTEQKEIQVIVKSGSVAFRAGGEEVILKANETGVFQKTRGQLIRKENKDDNFIGWKSNRLAFEESDFKDVIFVLNRHFHASIKLDNPALNTCKVTATYKDKTLDAVVRILEKTLDIKSRKEGDQIIFSGQGCE